MQYLWTLGLILFDSEATGKVERALFHLHSIVRYTYIHNWPLQPISQNYGLASHTTDVVCVNFTREWRDLQFNVDYE